ncbi:MAG: hypothetical protein AB7F59_02920 [Bdellovibrionales bacterium]
MEQITLNHFLKSLQQRVSAYDAKLILDSAVVTTGIPYQADALNSEEAKNLCLELIKKGGPAFQVGSSIYREIPQ